MKRRLRHYKSEKSYETMEDLIPDVIFEQACEKWFKKWGINDAIPNRPRMKLLDKHLQRNNKREMKNSLESLIVDSIRKDFKSYESDFSILQKILEDFNSRIN